tara:strand:+ start:21 stop:596 length:576 start_codon:yes stop_codon:yes gene_type:complete
MKQHFLNYSARLQKVLEESDWTCVETLASALMDAWVNDRQVFLCGNGGSAGNAIHLANDFLYGVAINSGIGLKVEALAANSAVLTCLANDLSYDQIYSSQLQVKARSKDILIVLSGSGNSSNVVRSLEIGAELGMKTFAILGFDGGKCKDLVQVPIHFPIDDMQIAEDLQLVIGHMCMQWLRSELVKNQSL